MNKIEALKQERDGLDVHELIARYAEMGWESIPEDDVQRLKWYGLFLRNPTPGFFMLRVRIPAGQTTSYQLRALAEWLMRTDIRRSSGRPARMCHALFLLGQ